MVAKNAQTKPGSQNRVKHFLGSLSSNSTPVVYATFISSYINHISDMAFTIEQYYNNPKRKRPRVDAEVVLELNVPPNLDEWETVRQYLSKKAKRNSADNTDDTDDPASDCDNTLYSTILLHLGYLLFHSNDDAMIRSICSCWAYLPLQDTYRTDAKHILVTLIQRSASTVPKNDITAEIMLVCLQIVKKQRYCEEESKDEDLTMVVKQLVANCTTPDHVTANDNGVSLLDQAIQFITTSTTERILPDPTMISKRPTVTDLIHDLGCTHHHSQDQQQQQQRALHLIMDYDPTTLMTNHHPQLLNAVTRCVQNTDLHDSCLKLWLHLCQHHPYHATLLIRTPKVLDAIVVVANSTSSSLSSLHSLNESSSSSAAAITLILLLSDIVVNRSIMAHHGGLLTAMIRMVRTLNETKTKSLMKKRILLLAAMM